MARPFSLVLNCLSSSVTCVLHFWYWPCACGALSLLSNRSQGILIFYICRYQMNRMYEDVCMKL